MTGEQFRTDIEVNRSVVCIFFFSTVMQTALVNLFYVIQKADFTGFLQVTIKHIMNHKINRLL